MRLRVAPNSISSIDDSIEARCAAHEPDPRRRRERPQPARRTRPGHGMNAREVDGIVLLDKPEGLSSNAALQRVGAPTRRAKARLTPAVSTRLPAACCRSASVRPPRRAASCSMPTRPICFRIALGRSTATGDREGDTVGDGSPCRSSTKASVRRVRPGVSRRTPCKCRRCTRRSSTMASASIAWHAPASKSERAPRQRTDRATGPHRHGCRLG